MLRRLLRDAISPSMVVALLALFVALGGTAWATTHARTRQAVLAGTNIVSVWRTSESVNPGSANSAIAMCPRGSRAIGGGAQHIQAYTHPNAWDLVEGGPVGPSGEPFYDEPGPETAAAQGWFAVMHNEGPVAGKFLVDVVCAPVVSIQR